MKRKRTSLEIAIREQIDFLHYARISEGDLRDMGVYEPDMIVLISPDVNSLHLAWQWYDGAVQHEISDWPLDTEEYETVGDWLAEEIGDDAYETIEDSQTIWDLASDWSEVTADTVATFDLARAERDYKQQLDTFALFSSMGID